MVIFPIVASGVSLLFAVLLFIQYRKRHRVAQLAWAIAMSMFALASAMVIWGVGSGWTSFPYRVFWIFGALLNVPWLAAGSVALVSRKPIGIAAFVTAIALSGYAFIDVARSHLDVEVLRVATGIPRGKLVWIGSEQVNLARWYSIIAWLIVVGIAAWSSRTRKGIRPSSERVRGNALIAIGVSIVAIGGFALSRIGRGSAFSITLALGVAVMFVGFLFASRAPRFHVEDPGESPT